MADIRRVVVVGLDGLEPQLVERMLAAGELPHLARLREMGGYSRVATTCPAQTPVAWSTFATGTNPGGHGIFDFIRRNPATYAPDLSLNRYEQKNPFVAPKAVNLRRGTPIWSVLSRAGVESVVLRCPCTFPPDGLRGRMLSGMGVPDLRGGLGTGTFYTSSPDVVAEEGEQLVRVAGGGSVRTYVVGPRHPKTREDLQAEIVLESDARAGTIMVRSEGEPRALTVRQGEWSDWLKIRFKVGLLQAVHGMIRFHLVRLTPALELFASPVNFDPRSPLFAISEPAAFAADLERAVGTFHTTGMVEEHGALNNGRITEEAYLRHCNEVLGERERMMHHELARLQDGLFFCLFDTPDRVQHMFWRFRETGHPANSLHGQPSADLARVIEDHYRACDAIVGRVLDRTDERTLCVVLSDHGFSSFQRGVHLNTWLHDNGFLHLRSGVVPGPEAGDLLAHVDWDRTKAYAIGIGSIYLNVKGREANGVVSPGDSRAVAETIVRGLTGLVDPARGVVAVRGAARGDDVYSGACAAEAPDVVALFAAGYRASWSTAMGGVPAGVFEDNVKRWGGDHIIDPALVPGVLFMNRPFGTGARLVDLAPTILSALGVPADTAMEGRSLL